VGLGDGAGAGFDTVGVGFTVRLGDGAGVDLDTAGAGVEGGAGAEVTAGGGVARCVAAPCVCAGTGVGDVEAVADAGGAGGALDVGIAGPGVAVPLLPEPLKVPQPEQRAMTVAATAQPSTAPEIARSGELLFPCIAHPSRRRASLGSFLRDRRGGWKGCFV
jgi:hypothetical protein